MTPDMPDPEPLPDLYTFCPNAPTRLSRWMDRVIMAGLLGAIGFGVAVLAVMLYRAATS